MLRVALTGNIASGKSTVAREWRALGATVVDADELARRAVEPGTTAYAEIVERWGPGVVDREGRLDRGALRELVFRNPAEREALEAIVHPRVAELREAEVRMAAERGEAVVVSDIPLLFEVGLADEFDLVVLVDAPVGLRRARIVRDRGIAPEEADRMIAAQMPSERKRARSDLIIDNTGTLAELRDEARRAWNVVVERAREVV